MKVISSSIPDIIIIEPTIFSDERGLFFESFNQKHFETATGRITSFIQENHSRSTKGVLRGLHYQLAPHAQGKLVRVIAGEVFDVAIDIRCNSPYFGQWVGVHLSAANKRQLWIPPGFAHGFLTLSDSAELLYKATAYWCKDLERRIAWDDPELAIAWPLNVKPQLSPKDADAPHLRQADLG